MGKMVKFSQMPYERVDFDGLKLEFERLEKALDDAQSGEEQFAIHQRYYELTGYVQTMTEIAQIRHDIDMTDEFYKKEQEYNDQYMPMYRAMTVSYQKKLYHSPYREYLESRIGKVAFKNIELAMKSVDEKIISLMQEENALQEEYNQILATAQIKWNGQTLNLSLLNPYMHSADRSVRRAAWDKYTDFYLKNEEHIEDVYDRMVRNRTKQGRALGYDNYLPLGYARMMRNCYGYDDIRNFRRQILEDLVPFAEKLYETRRQRLHLDHLSYIDEGVYFPQGNPAPTGTPQQILQAGQRMYHEMSPETARFMDFMCENELFDVLGRKTKKTGGYMTFLPDYNAPFIFANFNGSSDDADVITHECGHAFQGFLACEDPIREHWDITMETAETHSMSMEFFTEPWMELLFGNRASDYIQMHLEDSIMFIPYGTMVDEFQHIAYENPELTPSQRNGVWRDLERRYKPHLDYTGCDLYERGAFWQNKHHIFDCPLYYIDYCIAGMNALQYKIAMDRDYKKAWKSYLKLCRLSASDFFDGLMQKAGLVNVFEDGSMKYIVNRLREDMDA